jgi:hypothetical protein
MVLEPYPNPADQNLTLSWISPEARNINLTVSDVLGNTLIGPLSLESIQGLNTRNIFIGNLPKGIYILRFTYQDQETVKRIVRR